MQHLPSAEKDRELDLVALIQGTRGHVLDLDLQVMRIRLRSKADFFQRSRDVVLGSSCGRFPQAYVSAGTAISRNP